nr:SdrD B-like domain-containing protein [Pseudoroseomonas vastitatis]
MPDLSVGEAVTYRLTATLAEGSQRLVLTDTLPNGLQLVSAQVESIGANITGFSLRAGAAPAISGSTLTFDFGNVVNNLTDARDQVTVPVTARGVSGAAAGTPLTNNAVAQVFAPGGTAAVAQPTATQAMEVVRPEVAITKVSSIASGDAGDLVTFTVTLSQAAGSTAAAYNLAVSDLMPDGLTLVGGSARASAGTVSETAAGGIAFSLDALVLGSAPVTITYQARLSDGVSNGQSLAGPAQLSYATAPTGGTTASGAAAPAPVLVAITNGADSQLSATSLDATSGSNVGPGELVTLRLIGTLGEGAQRVRLAETLPAGLEYVSSRVVSLGATGSSLAVGAAGTVDAAAGRVNFNFGTLTNPGDNRVDAGDQLVVEGVARVAAGTAAGTQINPSGILTAATPTGTTTTSLLDGDVTLTVVSGTLGGQRLPGQQRQRRPGHRRGHDRGRGRAAAGRNRRRDRPGDHHRRFRQLRLHRPCPGSYAAQFTAPAGRAFTAADRGPDDARDSDANPVTGRSGTVSLTAGQNNRTVDAGFYVPASVFGTGNLVYSDSNGVRDAGESGLGGITVRLLDATGAISATTVTASDGTYGFAGVVPGTY